MIDQSDSKPDKHSSPASQRCVDSSSDEIQTTLCSRPSTELLENFLLEIPKRNKEAIVEYLRLGDPDVLRITETTFHDFLHIANELHHVSLLKACCSFFGESRRKEQILNDIKACKCSKTLVNTNCNFLCKPECACPKRVAHPVATKYAILFPKKEVCSGKNVAFVINLDDFSLVTQEAPNKLQHMGSGFASCAMYKNECPYVVISGGEGKHANILEKYDVILNKWGTQTKLKCSRVNHLMTYASGCIYIIGGNKCTSIEKFNPAENKTVKLDAKLLVEVRSPSAVVWRDKVFIFGGKSQRGHVSCVQCFDTRTNSVSRLPDLPCECSGGQAVVANDKVFIATHQGHMIAFDPYTGNSELCAHQPVKRKHFFMSAKDGEIVITDGVRSDGSDAVELSSCRYFPADDIWQKRPLPRKHLPIHASCTIVIKKRCPVVPFMDMYSLL